VSYAEQRKFGDLLIHPADFKHHRSGFDAGYPAFDFGFTLTHTGFERFGRIGMVGKYPDVHFAFAMQKVCGGYTTGFNLPAGNPAAFHSLQAVLSESDIIASTGIAVHSTAHLLAIFNSFGH
jgi:hypothetical protein